jgi:hypothetical protein
MLGCRGLGQTDLIHDVAAYAGPSFMQHCDYSEPSGMPKSLGKHREPLKIFLCGSALANRLSLEVCHF